jgi:hypothetical protein
MKALFRSQIDSLILAVSDFLLEHEACDFFETPSISESPWSISFLQLFCFRDQIARVISDLVHFSQMAIIHPNSNDARRGIGSAQMTYCHLNSPSRKAAIMDF